MTVALLPSLMPFEPSYIHVYVYLYNIYIYIAFAVGGKFIGATYFIRDGFVQIVAICCNASFQSLATHEPDTRYQDILHSLYISFVDIRMKHVLTAVKVFHECIGFIC